MYINRLCQRNVDVAEPDESAWQAAERMRQRSVGTLVVVDSNQQVVGMLTDRDLVTRVLANNYDPHETTVADVMSPQVITVVEDTPLDMALERMRCGPVRRMPVVDVRGRLVGLLSIDDVMMQLARDFGAIGQLLRDESPPAASCRTMAGCAGGETQTGGAL